MKDITSNKHGGNAQSKTAFDMVKQKLTLRQKIVLSWIALEQQATSKRVAELMRVPLNTISGRFTELKAAGKIQQVGRRDGCAIWQVIDYTC
jgi:predicted HTH transcriptional regulator